MKTKHKAAIEAVIAMCEPSELDAIARAHEQGKTYMTARLLADAIDGALERIEPARAKIYRAFDEDAALTARQRNRDVLAKWIREAEAAEERGERVRVDKVGCPLL